MIHLIAYVQRGRALTKCGRAVDMSEATAFGGDCTDCTRDAWPSMEQQAAAGFTGPGGKGALDKLAGRP